MLFDDHVHIVRWVTNGIIANVVPTTSLLVRIQAVNCGRVPSIQDGRVDFSGGTTFGSTITYFCNTGYTLTGDASRNCQANGTYDGSEPTCDCTYILYNETFMRHYNDEKKTVMI